MDTPEAELDTMATENVVASNDSSTSIGSSREPAEILERLRRGESSRERCPDCWFDAQGRVYAAGPVQGTLRSCN